MDGHVFIDGIASGLCYVASLEQEHLTSGSYEYPGRTVTHATIRMRDLSYEEVTNLRTGAKKIEIHLKDMVLRDCHVSSVKMDVGISRVSCELGVSVGELDRIPGLRAGTAIAEITMATGDEAARLAELFGVVRRAGETDVELRARVKQLLDAAPQSEPPVTVFMQEVEKIK